METDSLFDPPNPPPDPPIEANFDSIVESSTPIAVAGASDAPTSTAVAGAGTFSGSGDLPFTGAPSLLVALVGLFCIAGGIAQHVRASRAVHAQV